MVRKKKTTPSLKVSATEVRDPSSNAIVNTDSDAYKTRVAQKKRINNQNNTEQRIQLLEIKLQRLTNIVNSLGAK